MDLSKLSEEEIKLAVRLDAEVWFNLYGVLKDKEGKVQGKRKANVMQRRMFAGYRAALGEGKPFKALGLKPRQVGLSTVVQAITYHHNRNFPNLSGALMADKIGTADKVFEIYRTFAENDGYDWGEGNGRVAKFGEPGNLADEIKLPNGSAYRKETAGSARAGAGGTIQVANGTEVAHFPVIQKKDPALGFLNSWYDEGEMSLGMFDTTPNGPVGLFYDLWQDRKNGYVRIFSAWFEFEEHKKKFAGEKERVEFEESLDEDERVERERFKVSLEQLNWRRDTIKNKCQNDANRFRQEFPSDEKSCFLLSSRLRFKAEVVDMMMERCKTVKPEVGELNMQNDQTVSWRADDAGTVEILEHPRVGMKYLVSMDTCTGRDQQASGGKADPDYHSIGVLRGGYRDVGTGVWYPPKIVAHHWSRLESEYAALVAASMSIYYGRCIVIPEVNNCGLYHVKALEGMDIPIYERTQVNRTADTVDKMKGWKTDVLTRRTIIDNLAAKIAEWKEGAPTFECGFAWIIDQLSTFIRHKDGSTRAMNGKHDDGVMMLAIALENEGLCCTMKEAKVRRISADRINRREGWKET